MLSAYCAWRYTRPGLRRAWLMVQLLWGGALTALGTAPPATAAGFTNAVGWTGITDTTGQPIGSSEPMTSWNHFCTPAACEAGPTTPTLRDHACVVQSRRA